VRVADEERMRHAKGAHGYKAGREEFLSEIDTKFASPFKI
jgi:hypothetical protein